MRRFPEGLQLVLHTKAFRRLRSIRQAGLTRLAFPEMEQSHFAHAVGSTTNALNLLQALREQQPELGLTDREVNTVLLAASARGLGSGPVSPVFARYLSKYGWTAEKQSAYMLRTLADMGCTRLDIRAFAGVETACSLLNVGRGSDDSPPTPGKEFLLDIVANAASTLDVCFVDKLARDFQGAGLKLPRAIAEPSRVLMSCRAVDVGGGVLRLGWPVEAAPALAQLFRARFVIQAAVFQSAAVRAVDAMALEAMSGIWPLQRLGMTPFHMVHYYELETSCDWDVDEIIDGPESGAVLLRDLGKGVWWETVGEGVLPQGGPPTNNVVFTTEAAMRAETGLTSSAFAVDVSHAHCGMGPVDPLLHVPLFDGAGRVLDADAMVAVARDASSSAAKAFGGSPQGDAPFEQRVVRILCKDPVHARSLAHAARVVLARTCAS
jgi:hypothetical protein